MAAATDVVGGVGEDTGADAVEDLADVLVEVVVEEALRVGAVPGREYTGSRFVDDGDGSGVDEFVAEALDEEALDVLEGLPRADDDGGAGLVELGQEVERLARDLVVGAACRPQGLVDVEDEDVHGSFVLGVEVETGERLFPRCSRGDVGEGRALGEGARHLVFQVCEFVARALPVLEGDGRVDWGEEVHEVLVGPQPGRVELLVERVEAVVSFHGTYHRESGLKGGHGGCGSWLD